MTADDRLALIRAKSDRAKKHISELQAELRTFLDAKPYVVGAKREPQTRKLVYYVTSVRATPPGIPIIVGDVLQCLRSTLDHLAYQLLLVANASFDEHKVRFPICRSLESYKSERGRVVTSLRKDAQDAIDAVEPYAGGKSSLLWTLHDLNNVDKHRTILTAGGQNRSVDLARHMLKGIAKQMGWTDESIPNMKMFMRPADTGFPLKAGHELLILGPDDEPDKKQEFRFEVAFAESGIVKGKPVGETLHEMTNLVDGIVTSFYAAGLLT